MYRTRVAASSRSKTPTTAARPATKPSTSSPAQPTPPNSKSFIWKRGRRTHRTTRQRRLTACSSRPALSARSNSCSSEEKTETEWIWMLKGRSIVIWGYMLAVSDRQISVSRSIDQNRNQNHHTNRKSRGNVIYYWQLYIESHTHGHFSI